VIRAMSGVLSVGPASSKTSADEGSHMHDRVPHALPAMVNFMVREQPSAGGVIYAQQGPASSLLRRNPENP
jgi:hypothetical protein